MPPARTADLAFQKNFVARARRELGVTRASWRPGYLRDYDRAMGQIAPTPLDEAGLSAAVRPASLLLAADFHTLAQSQQTAARLLEFWTGLDPARPVTLALECLTAHDQRACDEFLAGRLDENQFLKAVRWAREWGFPFENYRPLFDAARRLELPVLAVDAHPRGDFTAVRRRDALIADRLALARAADPARRIFLVIGETHLAPRHLPARLHAALARRRAPAGEVAVVLQNVDSVWWELSPELREARFGWFALEPRTERARDWIAARATRFYMALSAAPVEKYESWRAYMAQFAPEDDARGDHSTAARTYYDLIEGLLGALRIPKSRCLEQSATRVRFLADCYPEVLGPDQFGEFGERVQQSRMPEARKQIVLSRAPQIGRFYCAPLNLMWIGDAPLADLTESAAYFILTALKGRVGEVRPHALPMLDRFAERVMEEGLSYAGSKFVGPERRFHRLDALRDTFEWLQATGVDPINTLEWRAEAKRYHAAEALLPALGALEMQFRRCLAGGRGARAAGRELERALADDRLFTLAVHEWGYELGERLFDRVQEGTLRTAGIRAMFLKRFTEPGSALRELRRWWRLAKIDAQA